ncbi:MAG TPA: hypothetical protein PLW59_05170, partial [Sphaerochaeta sp.]|nr:hypothetical protein [Sphaerochaeta sp.]
MSRRTNAYKRVVTTTLLLTVVLVALAASMSPLPFTRVEVRGQMPITEIFRVDQNEEALDFNLVESRNSIVQVGSYTLISNSATGQFT